MIRYSVAALVRMLAERSRPENQTAPQLLCRCSAEFLTSDARNAVTASSAHHEQRQDVPAEPENHTGCDQHRPTESLDL